MPQQMATTPPRRNFKISNLNDIDNLIKTAPIEEILKIRNDLSAKLNSSNQTKKSIIYDNYYELIKLSNTLSDLSTSKPRKKSVSTGLKYLLTMKTMERILGTKI